MRNQRIRRRLGGRAFMGMSSGIRSVSLCLQQLLVVAPSSLLCECIDLRFTVIFGFLFMSNLVTGLFASSSSTIFIFILAVVGVFYPYNRGVLLTALVVIYALTSGIAGYTAASFYCRLEGTNWVCNTILCSFFNLVNV